MHDHIVQSQSAIIVEDTDCLSMVYICHYCSLPAESIINMVEQGMIDPIEPSLSYSQWQFSRTSLLRIQSALRLQRDLELNLPGAILALELLNEIKQLRQQIAFCKDRESSQ